MICPSGKVCMVTYCPVPSFLFLYFMYPVATRGKTSMHPYFLPLPVVFINGSGPGLSANY